MMCIEYIQGYIWETAVQPHLGCCYVWLRNYYSGPVQRTELSFFFLEENISKYRKIKQWSSAAKGISAQWVMGADQEVPPMEELRAWSSQKRASQKCKIPTQRSFGKSMTQNFCPPAANPVFSRFSSKPWSTPHQLAQPFPLVKTSRTWLIMDENPQGLHSAFPTRVSRMPQWSVSHLSSA